MKYKSTDYYLLFQTNGVNFFFTDLCTKYYDKFNGVTLSVNNQWRYYVHLSERALAEEAYKSFYKDTDTVEKGAKRFAKVKDEALASKNELENKETVSLEAFDAFASQSAIIMDEYSKYDHMYTDYLFKDGRPEVARLIELVQENKNVFRDYTNQIFFNEDSYLVLLIKKIAKQTNIAEDELLYSSMSAVRQLLVDGTFTSEGKNGEDYALIRDNGEFTYLLGSKARDFIKGFLIEEVVTAITELKGISVSKKGIYKSFVRKVTVDYANLQQSVSLLNQVEAGSVLVTESTVPEMLSVMSRSLAVVTDMGGMLSHAAITCRELGIPCIIGTRIGTQVFQDGDHIEVDADNGIVRKI